VTPKRITAHPLVRFIGEGLWKLEEPFVYHVGSENSADVITVERGFITDFASVPRIFWAFYPPHGAYAPAAVVHDWLYARRLRPRAEADRIFLEAMAVLGVPWLRRHLLYIAVRIGGPRFDVHK
jgi:hypothetical protein